MGTAAASGCRVLAPSLHFRASGSRRTSTCVRVSSQTSPRLFSKATTSEECPSPIQSSPRSHTAKHDRDDARRDPTSGSRCREEGKEKKSRGCRHKKGRRRQPDRRCEKDGGRRFPS